MSSKDEKKESQLQKTSLKGHRASVNCLAHSSSSSPPIRNAKSNTIPTTDAAPSCLLSGSEDGTSRLWDLRTQRAALCIVAPVCDDGTKEVTSVAFHPLGGGGDEKANSGVYAKDMTVYLSVGSSVYGYDLRNATSPIIRMYDLNLSSTLECDDEVNQIAFSFPGKRGGGNSKVDLATADDSGDVRVADALPCRLSSSEKAAAASSATKKNNSQKQCRILHHSEEEDAAMATSIEFRPRASGLDLVSGGTDCAVRLWDVSRPRRPSSSVQIARVDAESAQVCNPPMVFDLSWSPSGRLLAAGLGDGTASILGIQGRSLSEKCRLRGGHSLSIACVLFPDFGCSSSSHVAAHDRLVISAGSDGAIMLWDLGSDIAGNNAVDPSSWLVGCDNIDQNLSALSLDEKKQKEPKILFGIPHEEKINFLTSSTSYETALSSSLFVADTSCDITAYIVARK